QQPRRTFAPTSKIYKHRAATNTPQCTPPHLSSRFATKTARLLETVLCPPGRPVAVAQNQWWSRLPRLHPGYAPLPAYPADGKPCLPEPRLRTPHPGHAT
ncbi:unnamed protein product, partial [Ectocarpus sp. 8 AP-2014]